MKRLTFLLVVFCFAILSCRDSTNTAKDQGASTSIDSTNKNGTAPATYGGNNPANDQKDTNKTNINDTGTSAANVHNTPVK